MNCAEAFILVLNAMMAVTTCYPLEMQQDDQQLQQTSNETSLLLLQFDASSNEPPPTKDKEDCVLLTDCAPLVWLLDNQDNLTDLNNLSRADVLNQIATKQCGFDDEKPKVSTTPDEKNVCSCMYE